MYMCLYKQIHIVYVATTYASYIHDINQTWQLNASNMNSKWSFNIERSPKIIAYHYIEYSLLVY